MPRPRLNPLFEIGDYWIGQEPNSPLLYRYWRDRNVGRTKRATLGTDDLEEAKIRLAEIVVRDSPATPESYLSTIFDKYCDEHGDKTATGTTARWTCRQYLECWGKNATASDVTEARQKQFAEWCVTGWWALWFWWFAPMRPVFCDISFDGRFRVVWPLVLPPHPFYLAKATRFIQAALA